MGFWGSLFGIKPGPTQSAKDFANQQNQLAQTMSNDFNQRFGAQSAGFQTVSNALTPVANLGPGQRGGSPEQWAAQNTLAINNAAASNRNTRQFLGSQLAGRGGGSAGGGLISGLEQQLGGEAASAAENQLSNATEENISHQYDVGNADFFKATAGLNTLSGLENPTELGKMAATDLSTAQQSGAQIDAQNQARTNSWAGLAKGLIGTGASFLTGGLSNLGGAGSGTSFGENVGNFFKGGVGNVFGNGTGTPGIPNAGQAVLSGDSDQLEY